MARGRKAQPDELKAAKGNPGRRPLANEKAELELPPVAETTPAYLSREAKAIWARVAPYLTPMNFFRATDVEGLARYCENLNNWWACERKLRQTKKFYETDTNHGRMLRLHPLMTAQNMYEKRLVALEDRLGLSPRARQEIIRGLAAQPPLGPLFPDRDKPDNMDGDTPPAVPSPVGLLQTSESVH